MADDNDEHPLDVAFARYTAGKIMRRDMMRMIIDAVKKLQASAADVPAAVSTPKRAGWPRGKKRGGSNGHAVIESTGEPRPAE